jgi:hypothetical protein
MPCKLLIGGTKVAAETKKGEEVPKDKKVKKTD